MNWSRFTRAVVAAVPGGPPAVARTCGDQAVRDVERWMQGAARPVGRSASMLLALGTAVLDRATLLSCGVSVPSGHRKRSPAGRTIPARMMPS